MSRCPDWWRCTQLNWSSMSALLDLRSININSIDSAQEHVGLHISDCYFRRSWHGMMLRHPMHMHGLYGRCYMTIHKQHWRAVSRVVALASWGRVWRAAYVGSIYTTVSNSAVA